MRIESDDFQAVQLGDEQFGRLHVGKGHGPATKRQARQARRRQRDAAAKELSGE